MDNHYEVLGLALSAPQEEIKRAFKNLALKYHPDQHPSPIANELFRRIKEAYEVLGDPDQRAFYDAELVGQHKRRQRPSEERGESGAAKGEASGHSNDTRIWQRTLVISLALVGLASAAAIGSRQIENASAAIAEKGQHEAVSMQRRDSPQPANSPTEPSRSDPVPRHQGARPRGAGTGITGGDQVTQASGGGAPGDEHPSEGQGAPIRPADTPRLRQARELVQANPESIVAQVELGYALAEAAGWIDLYKTTQAILARDPNNPDALIQQAMLRYAMRQPKQADGLIDQVLAREPDNIRALEVGGRIALRAESWSRAVQLLARAIEKLGPGGPAAELQKLVEIARREAKSGGAPTAARGRGLEVRRGEMAASTGSAPAPTSGSKSAVVAVAQTPGVVPAKVTATKRPMKRAALARAVEPEESRGYLIAASRPTAKVLVDGWKTGRETPIRPNDPLALSPGTHRITLVARGRRFHYTVTVKAQQTIRLVRVLPLP